MELIAYSFAFLMKTSCFFQSLYDIDHFKGVHTDRTEVGAMGVVKETKCKFIGQIVAVSYGVVTRGDVRPYGKDDTSGLRFLECGWSVYDQDEMTD